MTATATEIHARVGEFLGTLDEAIRLQEAALGCLRGLSDAVMTRDEDAVRRILAEAGAASEQFAALAQAREVAKVRLAAAVGCPPEERRQDPPPARSLAEQEQRATEPAPKRGRF
jgi:hypothetical protein